MQFYILLVLVAAATFAASGLLCAGALTLAWPRLVAAMPSGAASRARRLAIIRLAPVALGLGGAALSAITFLRFEPRDTTESASLVLLGAALISAVLVLFAAARIARGFRSSRSCRRLLRMCGERRTCAGTHVWVLDCRFPVAAVTGAFKTDLVLSRRILEGCNERELAAVLRHELAHIRRRDNVVLAAMTWLPDPFAHTRTGRAIQQAWAAAAEEAADDQAASDPAERTDLAAALVRVAGLTDTPPPAWVPALTFFERTTLESRVHRLLTERASAQSRITRLPVTVAAILAAAVVLSDAVGLRLHALMELAVRVLP